MITAWILYALVVGLLVGGGAMVVEKLLRAHRLPVRWVWVGAMLLSVSWPLGHLLWRTLSRSPTGTPPPLPARPEALEPLAVQVTPESFLRVLDGPVLVAWIAASGVLLALSVLLLVRTRRLRAEWKEEEAGGRNVLISEDWGPAVVGFLSPRIVLPRWCQEMDEETLRLILDHEAEHMKAGDLPLLLSAGILPLLLPWSVPLWWQMARLRVAVEGDCDLRVLRRNPHRARPYLELLLEVGGRLPRGRALAAMLSEPEETLERRIRIMTMPFPKNPWARGGLLAGVGAVLVALAFWAPGPLEVQDQAPAAAETDAVTLPPPEAEVPLPALESADEPRAAEREVRYPPPPQEVADIDLSDHPTFTPFTVRPDIRNRDEVARAMESEYPPLLRDAGIGGSIQVWFFIDARGRVQRTLVNESSGHRALDDAALRVAGVIEFTPALNREERVPVWISLPITFSAQRAVEEAPSNEVESQQARDRVGIALPTFRDEAAVELPPPPETGEDAEVSAAPTFTPFTVRPDIRNRAEVARALEREYPPLLRDAGIGGSVQVWFFIDRTGATRRVLVNETSGHQALDEAALRVAETIEFTPALNREEPVPVWISLPITFTTR